VATILAPRKLVPLDHSMRISFVIPTYNRAATLGAAIRSVLRQPYPGREIVVIDDGSTDDTVSVLREFAGEPAFRTIVFPTNRGQNVARNAGISCSTGEVVTILDSDDEALATDLAPIVDIFRSRPDIGIVFTGAVARSTGRVIGRMNAAGKTFGHEGFVNGTYRGEYQAFLRRAYLNCPVFDEELGIRRSCTLLTWLKLGQQFKCTILELPTRLYGDSLDNRMSNRVNILKDSHEIARCCQIVLDRYGAKVAEIAPRALERIVAQRCYYELLAHGRSSAHAVLREGESARVSLLAHIALLGLIALGPRVVRVAARCASRP
jgi:glycosyl transferase family 2